MSHSRRGFMRWTAAASAATVLGPLDRTLRAGDPAADSRPSTRPGPAPRPLKLLILGGTGFLGPHTVEAARARGHTLTLFNRGKTNPQLFPDIEKLHGNRDGDLKALQGRTWDAVVDNSGYVPRVVRASAELLARNVRQYVFISTMSVYSDLAKLNQDETAPVGKIADEKFEKITAESYGPLKALCEQAAEKALPGRTLNIRPGLIVGPGDPSDRFTYWPVRVDRGGEVLAPGAAADPVSYIDVRDLAEFIVHAVETGFHGVCNAVGPADGHITMGALLAACQAAAPKPATLTWVETEFLAAQSVQAWSDMPVWLPSTGETAGFASYSNRRATQAGLKFRPVEATVRDTLAWFKAQPEARRAKLRAGIDAARETKVLAAWHSRATATPGEKPKAGKE
ncbi:MAG: NAD-dependent epimerase/dehydratase family protein [Phycisphaerae bacterium]